MPTPIPSYRSPRSPAATTSRSSGTSSISSAPEALGRPLDRPGVDWNYTPAAKFERLLRHARVPIGLLSNRTQVRLIYAPHGETTGSITFDLTDMAEVGGRPMLDAFLTLLSRDRWLTQAADARLPALLEASRKQQAEVTERLADQSSRDRPTSRGSSTVR